MDTFITISILTVEGGIGVCITIQASMAAASILVMDTQRRRADMLVMASAAVALADFMAAGSLAAEVASMGAVVVDLEAEGTVTKVGRLSCELC